MFVMPEWYASLPWYGHAIAWAILTMWAVTPYYLLKALDRLAKQNDRIIQLLHEIKTGRD